MIKKKVLEEDLERFETVSEVWISVLEEVERDNHETYKDIADGVGDSGPRGVSNTQRKASFLDAQGTIYENDGGFYRVKQRYLEKKSQKL